MMERELFPNVPIGPALLVAKVLPKLRPNVLSQKLLVHILN